MASFGSNYGNGIISSINAAKVVTVAGPLALFCASNGGTFTSPVPEYNESEITFTKLDTVSTAAPVVRGTERRRLRGFGSAALSAVSRSVSLP